jgi:hypothetical protein
VQDDAPHQRSHPASPYAQPDRPMQSIERDDMPQVLPTYRSLPSTPQAVRPMQHQHHVVDLTQDSPGYAYPIREISRQEFDRRQTFRPAYHDQEVVDLTSPQGQYNERPMAQPEVIRVIPVRDDRYAPAPVDQYGYMRAPEIPSQAWRVEDSNLHGTHHEPRAAEYDPNRSILDVRDRGVYNAAPSPRSGSPTQLYRQLVTQLPSTRAYDQGQPMVQPIRCPCSNLTQLPCLFTVRLLLSSRCLASWGLHQNPGTSQTRDLTPSHWTVQVIHQVILCMLHRNTPSTTLDEVSREPCEIS